MRFSAKLQYMAQNEISELVGRNAIEQIRKKDAHPLFLAFAVGHEGDAGGNLIGVGNVVKKWFSDTIRLLYDKIKTGLEVFSGHVEDSNAHDGRVPIGRVVAKQLVDDYYGKTVIAVCYIFPEYRTQKLDVASIEADLDLDLEGNGQLVVKSVNEITGIALGNSRYQKPGFPGATLLGQLQAFEKTKHKENRMPTPEEIKQIIQEAGFNPSDLFEPDELAADPLTPKRTVRENVSADIAAGRVFYENRDLKRQLADAKQKLASLETEKKTLAEKVAEKDTMIATHAKANAKIRVTGELFEKAKTDRKLDDRQTKFIQARLGRFDVSKPEDVEKEFSSYLDKEIDELKTLEKDVFGNITNNGNDKPNNMPVGVGPTNHDQLEGTIPDNLNPAKNPYLQKID